MKGFLCDRIVPNTPAPVLIEELHNFVLNNSLQIHLEMSVTMLDVGGL